MPDVVQNYNNKGEFIMFGVAVGFGSGFAGPPLLTEGKKKCTKGMKPCKTTGRKKSTVKKAVKLPDMKVESALNISPMFRAMPIMAVIQPKYNFRMAAPKKFR